MTICISDASTKNRKRTSASFFSRIFLTWCFFVPRFLFSFIPLAALKKGKISLKLELLLGLNAELGLEGSKLLHVLLVESIGTGLDLETLKNADGGGVVVDAAGGLEGSLDDGGGGDEIVAEGVVQATLELEEVVNVVKELDETLGEVLKGLFLVLCGVVTD